MTKVLGFRIVALNLLLNSKHGGHDSVRSFLLLKVTLLMLRFPVPDV
jgi:hypothetical protein